MKKVELVAPLKIQTFQPIPEIFSGGLDAEIFSLGNPQGCPFFEARDFSGENNLAKSSQPGVVITGQQPGFMGGPLYTLYKIATTISLARLRSARGLPTVPVFWAGDDDDDIAEAISCQAWDPLRQQFFSTLLPANYSGSKILAELASRDVSIPAQHWFAALAQRLKNGSVAAKLEEQYSCATEQGWSFSDLFCSCIGLLFPDSGLIVVRGNDPRLHEIARPFYEKVLPRIPLLQKFTKQGQGQAINERSIENPLFRMDKQRRLRLSELPEVWDNSLRPGVMLRSLVQDWLFQPVAVVVGPGEYAYLKQLEPLYEHMDVRRAPMVPRLFATIAPDHVLPEEIQDASASQADTPEHHQAWAYRMQEIIGNKLGEILETDAALPKKLAQEIAAKKAHRMARNLPDFFMGAQSRSIGEKWSALPPWIRPDGLRQERQLATLAAYALWGKPLVAAIEEAANVHLRQGMENDWQEILVTVPNPETLLRKEDSNAR